MYLKGDDKFVKGLNAILDNPIDPLNPDVSFSSIFQNIDSEPEDKKAQTTIKTQPQGTYSTRYTPFFSSLGKEDNFPAMMQRISKKANEVRNESSSVREMFMSDLKNYTLTLPQDQKFLIFQKLQEIMEGME